MKTKLYIQIYSRILKTDIVKRSMLLGCAIGGAWSSLFIILFWDIRSWYFLILILFGYAISLIGISNVIARAFVKREEKRLKRDDGS